MSPDQFASLLPLLRGRFAYYPRTNDTLANPPWEESRPRILILRLSPLSDVSGSMTHTTLFSLVRDARPDAFIDFAFMPPEADIDVLKQASSPLARGIQSLRAPGEFSLILVSISYALEMLNFIPLLESANIPLRKSERAAAGLPAIVVGGASASACQALVLPEGDGIPDAFFFGEADTSMRAILDWALDSGTAPRGLWPCGSRAGEPVRAECEVGEAKARQPVLNDADAGTARLRISLGCPFSCNFCFEGNIRKPYRDVGMDALETSARRLYCESGAEHLDVVSFNFNTHTSLHELSRRLCAIFPEVHLMSQRLEGFRRDPALLDMELATGKRSFTLGIEGISARVRGLYGKNFAAGDIEFALSSLLRAKPKEIKLFYILSGSECEADVDDFRSFLAWLSAERARYHSGCRVIFSFGRLVAMPQTPFQWARLKLDERDWTFPVSESKCAVETLGFEFRLAFSFAEYLCAQSLVLANERGWKLLEVFAKKEILYFGSLNDEAAELCRSMTNELGLDAPAQLRALRFDSLLDPGKIEAWKNKSLELSAPPASAEITAYRTTALAHSPSPATRAPRRVPLGYLKMILPREFFGAGHAWIQAYCNRVLRTSYPELSAREIFFGSKAYRGVVPAAWHGELLVLCEAFPGFEHTMQLLPYAGETDVVQRIQARVEFALADGREAQKQMQSLLSASHLPHTLRRQGEELHFELAPAARKKRLVFDAAIKTVEGRTCADVSFSPRFAFAAAMESLEAAFFHRNQFQILALDTAQAYT